MAERSTRSQANIHENYKAVFGRFGKFNIQTGQEMTKQFLPWYLGMAFPFTLPSAVGGYDVPGYPRWRRPEDDALPEDPRSLLPDWMTSMTNAANDDMQPHHMAMGPACKVKLFDLTRGLPQRIEGQYRRHWGFTPALWNLYFREQVNLGISLNVQRTKLDTEGDDNVATDAAIAAADLMEKLEEGYYRDNNNNQPTAANYWRLQ